MPASPQRSAGPCVAAVQGFCPDAGARVPWLSRPIAQDWHFLSPPVGLVPGCLLFSFFSIVLFGLKSSTSRRVGSCCFLLHPLLLRDWGCGEAGPGRHPGRCWLAAVGAGGAPRGGPRCGLLCVRVLGQPPAWPGGHSPRYFGQERNCSVYFLQKKTFRRFFF